MNNLVVYKASAGSGKTFTLAVKYISQLIKNAAAYKSILAVTFTNKATAEMKERILSRLFGIAHNDKNSKAYLKEVCRETKYSEDEVRSRAQMALKLMIHDYSHFHVETIDSFFQSIMRNLTRELNLTPNIEISLDNQQILSDAVDEMIEKQTDKSPELSWIMEFIEEKIAKNNRWNPERDIKKFGLNLFNEVYLKNGETLRDKMKNPLFIASFNKKINKIRAEKQKVFVDLRNKFNHIIEENSINPLEDISNGNDVISYFNKLTDNKFDEAEPGKRLNDKMNDAEKWYKKTSRKHDEVVSLAQNTLIPLLEEAEEKRKTDGKDIFSCDLTLQQIYKVGLLNAIDKEVMKLNNEHNRFLLSNTSDLLHRIIGDSDTSFIFEKVGTVIRNVMIDEFQDTSQLQWENFKLLLLECLSKGEQSLLVGDVKQSIYRWRNSDWNILNNLKDHIDSFPIKVESLDTNRRSERNIVNFNNEFFTQATLWFKQNYGEERCKNLINAYSDVIQKTPDSSKEPKGFVGISFLDGKDKNNYNDNMLEQLANTVNDLIGQGLSMNDITILIRKKKYIPDIAKYFEEKYPQYSIVSDEAFQLQSSSAIQLIIDAMRYLNDCDNRIAEVQLALNYQHNVLHEDVSINSLSFNELDKYLPQSYITGTDALKMMSIYELTEKIFTVFGIDRMEGQENYLFSFLDAVQDYTANYPSDLGQFLSYWDETLCTQTIPVGSIDGIRIISIHKSKGLEFHTVLIPYCDWSLENETSDQLVWCKPQEEPYDEMPLVAMNYTKKMNLSIYNDDYDKEQLQLWVDNLNLLYVAFTRASKNLIVWGKVGGKKCISDMLTGCLQTMDSDFTAQPGSVYATGMLYLEHEKKETVDKNIIEQPPIPEEIKLKTFEQKNITFKQSNKSADFIEGKDDKQEKYIQEGLLMHQLFACIETTNDIEQKTQLLVDDGVINTKDVPKIKKITEEAINNPKVKNWYDGNNEIFNEREIIWRDKDGKLMTRRPDRIMLRDGQITIVDFKFGVAKPEYDIQMKGYMKLIHQIGYDKVEGYLWYVHKNNIVKVEN